MSKKRSRKEFEDSDPEQFCSPVKRRKIGNRRNALIAKHVDDINDDPDMHILNHLNIGNRSSLAVDDKFEIIQDLLNSHWLFKDMHYSLRTKVFNEFFPKFYKKGDVIFKKNKVINNFGVIEKGKCIDSKTNEIYATKDTFGDITLIQKEMKLKYTLKCLEDTIIWMIDSGVYKFICKQHGQQLYLTDISTEDEDIDLNNNNS